MSKEIYISSTPHETRLAIVENDDLTEVYYERENEYTLAGSIYNGKVTRVLPGMQSSFVDIGLERDAFLYITDFMEEAGDSADFESADGSGGPRRAQHEDRNGRSADRSPRQEPAAAREDRGTSLDRDQARDQDRGPDRNQDRGQDRNQERNQDRNPDRSLAAPASPSDGFSERPSREGGGRRRRGSRDARGGNRGERNGESRGRVDDRSPSPLSQDESEAFSSETADTNFEPAPAVHSGYTEPDGSAANLGEGAPGADGSRRWRGRRGRRRGRSSVQRDEASSALPQSGIPASAPDLPGLVDRAYGVDSGGAEEIEENFEEEYTSSFDVDAAAEPPAPSVAASLPPAVDPAPTSVYGNRGDRNRGDDRDSRDRNRRDRGGRDRAPRTPRGFTPSTSLYGVDSTPEAESSSESAAAGTPLILPGESLSKYRKNDGQNTPASSSPAATSISAPRPSTEFILSAAWNGGSVLPGETIRPRSGDSSAREVSGRSGFDRGEGRGSRDRGGRDDRRSRSGSNAGRGERSSTRDESQFQVSASAPLGLREGAAEGTQHLAEANTSDVFRPLEILDVPEAMTPDPVPNDPARSEDRTTEATPQPPFTQEAPEYDPEEGSASFRVDPATRREFRQSAPVAEPIEISAAAHEPAPTDPSDLHQPSIAPATADADYSQSAAPGLAPDILRDARTANNVFSASEVHTITPQAGTPIAPIRTTFSEGEGISGHEFTSIQNSGEMISDLITPPQAEIVEPASPLQHETAILEALPPAPPADHTAPAFVEEEEIEQEDFDTTLHASSIEEMDYEEEETLEGAADLGTMIREMSIDQITKPGDQEEDDILEEEDAVDDHLTQAYDPAEEDLGSRGFDESPEGTATRQYMEAPEEARDLGGEDLLRSESTPSGGFEASRDPDRRSSRRDGGGRRDSRGRDRDRGGERARSAGGSGDRSTSRPGRRDGRHSAQLTNLPAISDLLKPGQEVLVQIAKEPIAKKGARITSHIALPGRFLVFMPTVNHTGVSRKIESDGERRRLKEILLSEKGEASGGFIVRTAAANASEEELRSDLRFLLNLWADIKQRSESSKSPALIYHDLNLVERILRDQVTDNFSAIWVDTESEYERVLRFLQRFQPSLIRRVKLYTKEAPLFEQFGITEEINKALRSKVWLKSGGSIVINQTEALVAIDINTGKYVGKTARLEDTIVKTNLDAIPEIVRQIRLRDLGGIIIIDFIDMDERKNRFKVMAALEEELKKDRAPSKVLQFNDFGLVAITRKRVKQSLERTLSATCNICQGTGMTKSPVTVCNDIYIEMRKMQKHLDRGDVMLRVNPEVVKQLKAGGTRWLQEMEEMVGKTILVKSDPSLHPEQFDIH